MIIEVSLFQSVHKSRFDCNFEDFTADFFLLLKPTLAIPDLYQ